jgi:hypothetical protein
VFIEGDDSISFSDSMYAVDVINPLHAKVHNPHAQTEATNGRNAPVRLSVEISSGCAAVDQALALSTSAWPTTPVACPQTEPLPLRNEAQLNCVSLRSQLDYEVAWRVVKAQDERSLTTTPLTSLQAATDVLANVERK